MSIQAADMITIAMILAGALIAVALDWAIYTHLSAYLRAGLRLSRYFRFRELICTRWQKGRLGLVLGAGAIAGVSFAESNPNLWLFALVIFLLGHALIYPYLFRRS